MSDTGSTYAKAFMMHREPLVTLLKQVPDEQGDFTPWEGGMSFQKLTDHLAISSERCMAMMRGEALGKPEPAADFAAAKARLTATTAPLQEALAALSEEDLGKTVDAFGGRKMPLATLLTFMREHEAHHKGQLWTMARMAGIEPPLFVNLG